MLPSQVQIFYPSCKPESHFQPSRLDTLPSSKYWKVYSAVIPFVSMAEHFPSSPSLDSDGFAITPTSSSSQNCFRFSNSTPQAHSNMNRNTCQPPSVTSESEDDLSASGVEAIKSQFALRKTTKSDAIVNMSSPKLSPSAMKGDSNMDSELAKLVGMAYLQGLKGSGTWYLPSIMNLNEANQTVGTTASGAQVNKAAETKAPATEFDQPPQEVVIFKGVKYSRVDPNSSAGIMPSAQSQADLEFTDGKMPIFDSVSPEYLLYPAMRLMYNRSLDSSHRHWPRHSKGGRWHKFSRIWLRLGPSHTSR